VTSRTISEEAWNDLKHSTLANGLGHSENPARHPKRQGLGGRNGIKKTWGNYREQG